MQTAPFALVLALSILALAAGPAAEGGDRVVGSALPEVKRACTLCHTSHEPGRTGPLKQPPAGLCASCHQERITAGEHVVDVVPSMPVAGLPLRDGKMTCITCHDPHQNRHGSMLRLPAEALCLACHSR